MKLISVIFGLASLALVQTAEVVWPFPTTTPSWTTSVTTLPTPRSSSTATVTPTSTSSGVITSITVLPPRTSSTITTSSSTIPCPRVTQTTSPDGCEPIRCPVPTCAVEKDFIVPCGCEPSTVLFVTGCATACPGGCITRTRTTSLEC